MIILLCSWYKHNLEFPWLTEGGNHFLFIISLAQPGCCRGPLGGLCPRCHPSWPHALSSCLIGSPQLGVDVI